MALRGHIERLSEDDQKNWLALHKRHPNIGTLATIAQYWTDGRRDLLAVTDQVELETGLRDVEALVTYFEFLAKAGLVSWVK